MAAQNLIVNIDDEVRNKVDAEQLVEAVRVRSVLFENSRKRSAWTSPHRCSQKGPVYLRYYV